MAGINDGCNDGIAIGAVRIPCRLFQSFVKLYGGLRFTRLSMFMAQWSCTIPLGFGIIFNLGLDIQCKNFITPQKVFFNILRIFLEENSNEILKEAKTLKNDICWSKNVCDFSPFFQNFI